MTRRASGLRLAELTVSDSHATCGRGLRPGPVGSRDRLPAARPNSAVSTVSSSLGNRVGGVALQLVQVNFKARDDSALGRFWAEALDWGVSSEEPGATSVRPVGFADYNFSSWQAKNNRGQIREFHRFRKATEASRSWRGHAERRRGAHSERRNSRRPASDTRWGEASERHHGCPDPRHQRVDGMPPRAKLAGELLEAPAAVAHPWDKHEAAHDLSLFLLFGVPVVTT
jgi:hypothetical protein